MNNIPGKRVNYIPISPKNNKLLKSVLSHVLLFILLLHVMKVYGSSASSNASGNLGTNSNWTPSTPTAVDTLYINHSMTWTSLNWSSASVKVIVVKSGGIISPGNTNSLWTLPANTELIILTGGTLMNSSGNNSGHSIVIGSTGVWGKATCGSSNSISGPAMINSSTPCGFIMLTATPLSIVLEKQGSGVRVSWTSIVEEKGRFIIERSYDESEFTKIQTFETEISGSVPAKFSLLDEPANKSVTYKILWEDALNQIRELYRKRIIFKDQFTVKINNGAVCFNLENVANEASIEVLEISGKVVTQKKFWKTNELSIENLNTGGIYFIKISIDGEKQKTLKVLLQ